MLRTAHGDSWQVEGWARQVHCGRAQVVRGAPSDGLGVAHPQVEHVDIEALDVDLEAIAAGNWPVMSRGVCASRPSGIWRSDNSCSPCGASGLGIPTLQLLKELVTSTSNGRETQTWTSMSPPLLKLSATTPRRPAS